MQRRYVVDKGEAIVKTGEDYRDLQTGKTSCMRFSFAGICTTSYLQFNGNHAVNNTCSPTSLSVQAFAQWKSTYSAMILRIVTAAEKGRRGTAVQECRWPGKEHDLR